MTAVPFHPGLFAADGPGEQPRLIASRCRSCGRHAFPAKVGLAHVVGGFQAGDAASVSLILLSR